MADLTLEQTEALTELQAAMAVYAAALTKCEQAGLDPMQALREIVVAEQGAELSPAQAMMFGG